MISKSEIKFLKSLNLLKFREKHKMFKVEGWRSIKEFIDSNYKMVEIYQSSDVYLTTKYLDPCPNSVIEAMACGLPIIYSNSGGIPELVGDKCGIGLDVPLDWEKIHVPEPLAIAESMHKIYYSFEEMSLESRNRALEKFDLTKWIQRHEYIFKKFLK